MIDVDIPRDETEEAAKATGDGAKATPAPEGVHVATLSELFYFATKWDKVYLAFGCTGYALGGVAQSSLFFFFGDSTSATDSTSVVSSATDSNSAATIRSQFFEVMIKFFLLGAGVMIAEFAGFACIERAKVHQTAAWKKGIIRAVLRQDIGWCATACTVQALCSVTLE